MKRRPEINLTLVEIRRLLTRLAKQHKSKGVWNVGFGLAKKGPRLNPARGPSVVFFVKRKWKSPRHGADNRLPESVTLYVDRKGRRHKVVLATDVIQQKRKPRPSGLKTKRFSSPKYVTTGVVVTWKTLNGIEQWGVLTVAHFLPDPIANDLSTRLVTVQPNSGTAVVGEVILRMPRSKKIDAALIRIDHADLEEIGLTGADGSVVRSFAAIAQDGGKSCVSFPFDAITSRFNFSAGHYLASLDVGTFQCIDVLKGEGRDGIFAEGRSGCVWKRAGELVAHQVARLAPDDDVGYGQVFLTIWEEVVSYAVLKGIAETGSMTLIRTF